MTRLTPVAKKGRPPSTWEKRSVVGAHLLDGGRREGAVDDGDVHAGLFEDGSGRGRGIVVAGRDGEDTGCAVPALGARPRVALEGRGVRVKRPRGP